MRIARTENRAIIHITVCTRRLRSSFKSIYYHHNIMMDKKLRKLKILLQKRE
jgi:hypothetical protein